MRNFKSRFQQPFEMDLGSPVKGLNLIPSSGGAQPDFQYCRNTVNMWLSSDGFVETRPGIKQINRHWRPGWDKHPVEGLYWSNIFNRIFFSRDGHIYSIRKVTEEEDKDTYLNPYWSQNYVPGYDTNQPYNVGDYVEILHGDLPDGRNDYTDFMDFQSKLYIACGKGLQYIDGLLSGWPLRTQTNAADTIPIPSLTHLGQWRERLWGIAGETIYGSGYRTADDWGPADGSVTTSLGGWIDVRPGDGAKVTGICVYQGGFYCSKCNENGTIPSFWEITGSSFRSDSTDPFSLRLLSDGVGCLSPLTMEPTLNSVCFYGNGHNVYTEQTVQEYTDPQSVPINTLVHSAFLHFKGLDADYQPSLGYYFLLLEDESYGETTEGFYRPLWLYHPETGGWWRWDLGSIRLSHVSNGPERDMYFGDDKGFVYYLGGEAGIDEGPSMYRQYQSGFTTQILNASIVRDKFFEWFYMSYVPLGMSGEILLSYREGQVYPHTHTPDTFVDYSALGLPGGWDSTAVAWDDVAVAWDLGSSIEKRSRVNRRNQTMQISLQASAPFRLLSMQLTGGVLAQGQRGWFKKK